MVKMIHNIYNARLFVRSMIPSETRNKTKQNSMNVPLTHMPFLAALLVSSSLLIKHSVCSVQYLVSAKNNYISEG